MITWKDYEEDLALTVLNTSDLPSLDGASFLITGSTGLIGSYLTDMLGYARLKYGYRYTVYAMSRSAEKLEKRFPDFFHRSWFHPIVQDVANFSSEGIAADYIINAASNAHPALYAQDPVGTITTNIFGAYHLLRYAAEHPVRCMLELSSVEIYGENRGDVDCFQESYCGRLNCNTARGGYPESKRTVETLCHAFCQAYGVNTVIARPCRIYGPTMELSDSKASAQFIKKALGGDEIVLKSAGDQVFSYAYVADVASALITLITRGQTGEAYNISDPHSVVRLREFAELTAQISGKEVRFEIPTEEEQRGFSGTQSAVLDSAKLQQLGWNARIHLPEGIQKTIKILSDMSQRNPEILELL